MAITFITRYFISYYKSIKIIKSSAFTATIIAIKLTDPKIYRTILKSGIMVGNVLSGPDTTCMRP